MALSRRVKFQQTGPWRVPGRAEPFSAFLVFDNWNDYNYRTLFRLHMADASGEVADIGSVKIARFGMGDPPAAVSIPASFHQLAPDTFSLGQDVEYYEKLQAVAGKLFETVLSSLGDIAADEELYQRALEEQVTTTSLLRSVSPVAAEGQFRRIARREDRVVRYSFDFHHPGLVVDGDSDGLSFVVNPGSAPPSNVHAVIGSNGAGKTWLLSMLESAATVSPGKHADYGELRMAGDSTSFAGLVSVSFSAFDEHDRGKVEQYVGRGMIKVAQVGLKARTVGEGKILTKSSIELESEFCASLAKCGASGRLQRWRRMIAVLESDLVLQSVDWDSVIDGRGKDDEGARRIFSPLSSGHKIVLLTITRLVELVEERTLVLLDEPETHLHPPLLAGLMNAISTLLAETNGAAIAATHSPVVLQEIPASCVWVVARSAHGTEARRPRIETFAENVGELTHEVFGLEVIASGYYARIKAAADEFGTYEGLLRNFGGHVGMEGRAIARSIGSGGVGGLR